MQTVRFFNVTLLGIYRWLIEILSAILKRTRHGGQSDSQEKDYSFLGNDTFPNLYDTLVYERKFKSKYLERQIYERSLKSEPSIVKLIEKLSEPSIVKFIENQSEHLSKFIFKKISMIDIPKSSKLHRYVNKVRKLYHARYKCNNKRDPKIINLNKMAIPKKAYLLSFFSRHYHRIMKLKCKARRYLSLFSCNCVSHMTNYVNFKLSKDVEKNPGPTQYNTDHHEVIIRPSMQNHSSTMQLNSPISSENLMQSRLGALCLQSIDVGRAGDCFF